MSRMNWSRVRSENQMEKYGREPASQGGSASREAPLAPLARPSRPMQRIPRGRNKGVLFRRPNPSGVQPLPSERPDFFTCPRCGTEAKMPTLLKKHLDKCTTPRRVPSQNVVPLSATDSAAVVIARSIEEEGSDAWTKKRSPNWVLAGLIETLSQLQRAATSLERSKPGREPEFLLVQRTTKAITEEISKLKNLEPNARIGNR